jgi:hypothetical protein
MDIELRQTGVLIRRILSFLKIISLYIEALFQSFHKTLKTSSITFFGLLSEQGGYLQIMLPTNFRDHISS